MLIEAKFQVITQRILSMKSIAARTLRSVCVFALALPSVTWAVDIGYEFQIDWFEGPLAGTFTTGWFAYDSSVVVPGELPGHTVTRLDILSGFSMDVRGIHFDANSVKSPSAAFGPNGELTAIQIGTSCSITEGPPGFYFGSCAVSRWSSSSFVFNYIAGNPEGTALIGTDGPISTAVFSEGTISITPLSAVPELPVYALLSIGVAALALRYSRVS